MRGQGEEGVCSHHRWEKAKERGGGRRGGGGGGRADEVAPCSRRERERECVCVPPRLASGALAGSGPKPAGVGGAAMPRGRSEQGRGREADRWGHAVQCQSVWVKWYSNHFKIVKTDSNKL
jgi:hypothetical protein